MKRILVATAVFALILPAPVIQAQQISEPWSFKRSNRAQIAVILRQVQDSESTSTGTFSAAASAGVGGTTIVCGGGSATAQANNTCIILNNSTGQISTDQISDGDQTATNSESTNENRVTVSEVDEVLSTLSGG